MIGDLVGCRRVRYGAGGRHDEPFISTDTPAMNYRSRTDEQLYDVTSNTSEDVNEPFVREYAKIAARILHRMDQDSDEAFAKAA